MRLRACLGINPTKIYARQVCCEILGTLGVPIKYIYVKKIMSFIQGLMSLSSVFFVLCLVVSMLGVIVLCLVLCVMLCLVLLCYG